MCYWEMVAVDALFTFAAIEIDTMMIIFTVRRPVFPPLTKLAWRRVARQQRWWHRRYWWYNVSDQLELSL